MAIYNNVTELIGKTPILKLNNYSEKEAIDILIRQAQLRTELQLQ